MRLTLFFLVGFLVSLTACDSLINDVDPDRLPSTEGKLVVQCYLSPQDTLLRAAISLSRPVLGTGNAAPWNLDDWKVVLSEGNRSIELKYDPLLYTFIADPRQFPIEAGKTYQLRVQAGTQSVTASCTVPKPISIASARLDSSREQTPFNNNQPWIYDVRLTWQDPVGQENYYRVAGEVSTNQWVTLTTFTPNGPLRDTIQRYLPLQSLIFFGNTEQHISDRNRDGQVITSPKGTIPNYLTYSYVDTTSKMSYSGNAPITKRPVAVTVMLLHVDRHYYEYHRTLQQQNDIDGNPFAEPVLISTNIEGGLGCFGAYNRTINTVTLP
ncbi:hypothetical protein GCM10027347_32920 [Larkinella harenae]